MNDLIVTAFTAQSRELLDIKEKIKFLLRKEKELSGALQEVCEFQTTSHNGYTYKNIERIGIIKYSDIPELKGLNLEPYRGSPIVTWKLSFEKQFDI